MLSVEVRTLPHCLYAFDSQPIIVSAGTPRSTRRPFKVRPRCYRFAMISGYIWTCGLSMRKQGRRTCLAVPKFSEFLVSYPYYFVLIFLKFCAGRFLSLSIRRRNRTFRCDSKTCRNAPSFCERRKNHVFGAWLS